MWITNDPTIDSSIINPIGLSFCKSGSGIAGSICSVLSRTRQQRTLSLTGSLMVCVTASA